LAQRPSMVNGYDLNVIDDGFPLSPELVRTAKEIDLIERPAVVSAQTLVVHIRKKDGAPPKPITELVRRFVEVGTRCELRTALESSLPWRHEEFYATHSPNVLATTLSWLEGLEPSA